MEYKIFTEKTRIRQMDEPLRILHAADLHLGQAWGVARAQSERSVDRSFALNNRKEGFEAFRGLLELAVREQVHLLVLAGDILEFGCIEPREINWFISELQELPCPVVIATGNHDPFDAASPYQRYDFGPNIHIMATVWEGLYFPDLKAVVWGISFKNAHEVRCLMPAGNVNIWLEESGLNSDSAFNNESLVQIGLMHGQVGASTHHAPYNPLVASNLQSSQFDFVALGHVHKPYFDLENRYSYSGSLIGRGFDELGARGAQVVNVLPAPRTITYQFYNLAWRHFYWQDLEVEFADNISQMAKQILTQLETLSDNYRIHYWRLNLKGSKPLDLPYTLAQLELYLANSLYYVRLYDKSHPTIDLETLAGEFSLRGLVAARGLNAIASSQTDASRDLHQQALELALRAFRETVNYEEEQ